MGSLVPRLILSGLAASISPVAVMVLITILSRKSAKRNTLLYILGFTATLLALGITIVFIFRIGGSGGTSKVDAYIDIVLGALCLAVIPLSVMRKSKPKEPQVEKGMKASRAVILGGVTMIANTSTLVIFIAGLHAISAAALVAYETALSIAVLTFFTLTTLLIPIAVYFIFPGRSERVLAVFQGWLSRHSKVIGAAVLLVFGIYLLVKGIMAL